MANFYYGNRNLRIGEEPATHREDSQSVMWAPTSLDAWSQGNWDAFQQYIRNNCRGTTEGAQLIQEVLNTLNKYTGPSGQKTMSSEDMQFLGITNIIANDLIKSLRSMNLGTSGTAKSLLNYYVDSNTKATAQNAGFSFESRISEFIQRLAGRKRFKTVREERKIARGQNKGKIVIKTIDERKALRTGTHAVQIGGFLRTDLQEIANEEYQDWVEEISDEFQKEVNQGNSKGTLIKYGYKVPEKADITIPATLTISGEFGPTIDAFLKEIRGKSLSLKNTSQDVITIGATQDNTRLIGFSDLFFQGSHINFGGLCSFIFASKNSDNPIVQKYTDWGRVFYELMGVGQLNGANYILADYIIINSYMSGGGAYANVYATKDLVNGSPVKNVNPPFIIANKDGKYHEGDVDLDLTSLPKTFIFGNTLT